MQQPTCLLKIAPIIWVLFGCQTSVPRPNNFTEKEIQLKDEQALPIAKVKVSVPIAFDTLLVWSIIPIAVAVKPINIA